MAEIRPYDGDQPYIFISYAHANSRSIIAAFASGMTTASKSAASGRRTSPSIWQMQV